MRIARARPPAGFVVDLGADLFSARWWRGLANCVGACAAYAALAPALDPLPAPAPPPLSAPQWEEADALSSAPLAYGADSGRRLAPTTRAVPLTDVPERTEVALRTLLGRGESLARVLIRAGVWPGDALEAEALLRRYADLSQVRPGTPVDLVLGRRAGPGSPRPLERLQVRARLDLQLSLVRGKAGFSVQPTPVPVDSRPLRIAGRVGDSLYHSLRAAGTPPRAVAAYLRALSAHVGLGELPAAARFDLVLANRRAATGENEPGDLLFAGLERPGLKPLQLLRWTGGQFYDAGGIGRTAQGMAWPVAGRITSNYGWRRHPILGFSRLHKGMDFGAASGTPVHAPTDGIISRAGWAGGYGRQVRIDHGGGIATSFSHLSRYAAAPGTRVRAGQVIGYVGSSGLSTGPHLHYELYRNGLAVDPRSVRFLTRATLNEGEQAAFRARLGRMLAVK